MPRSRPPPGVAEGTPGQGRSSPSMAQCHSRCSALMFRFRRLVGARRDRRRRRGYRRAARRRSRRVSKRRRCGTSSVRKEHTNRKKKAWEQGQSGHRQRQKSGRVTDPEEGGDLSGSFMVLLLWPLVTCSKDNKRSMQRTTSARKENRECYPVRRRRKGLATHFPFCGSGIYSGGVRGAYREGVGERERRMNERAPEQRAVLLCVCVCVCTFVCASGCCVSGPPPSEQGRVKNMCQEREPSRELCVSCV